MGPSLSQVLPKKQNTKTDPRNDNQSETNKNINFVDANYFIFMGYLIKNR